MVSSTELNMSQTGDDFLLRFSLSLSLPMMTTSEGEREKISLHWINTCNRISVNSRSSIEFHQRYTDGFFLVRQRQQAETRIDEYLSRLYTPDAICHSQRTDGERKRLIRSTSSNLFDNSHVNSTERREMMIFSFAIGYIYIQQ